MTDSSQNNFKEKVRSRADIVEIVSGYTTLRQSGKSFKGLCPFHEERNPSFHVRADRQTFHCFSCGEGGDVFHFVMRAENLSFREALEFVAERYGLEPPERPHTPAPSETPEERKFLRQLLARAHERYAQTLKDEQAGREAREYLAGRGVGEELIEEFGLGFAPEGWDFLSARVRSGSRAAAAMEKLGLVSRNARGGLYDRFRNRVIFPIMDTGGIVAGFGGRVLADEEPKYLNSPESPVFNKRRLLFGVRQAHRAIAAADRALLVEGYLDVILLHGHGVKTAVGTLGTALGTEHLALLRRYTKNVVLLFDADEAGLRAAERSLPMCLEAGVYPCMVQLPQGMDPDDFVRREGGEALQRLVDAAPPLLEFFLEKYLGEAKPGERGRIAALERIIPLLEPIRDNLERGVYVSRVAEALRVPDTVILGRLGESRRRAAAPAQAPGAKNGKVFLPPAERTLLHAALLLDSGLDSPEEQRELRELAGSAFEHPGLKSLLGVVLGRWARGEKCGAAELLDEVEDGAVRNFLAEISHETGEITQENAYHAFHDALFQLRRTHILKRREDLDREITVAWNEGRIQEAEQLLRRKKDLEKILLGLDEGNTGPVPAG